MISPDKLPPVLHGVWGPQWGFVGYTSALVLGLLRLSPSVWEVMHTIFFWGHFFIVTALLFLLPFSRFFHVILSPIVVAYNTTLDQEAHESRQHARRKLPRPAA
jgi:hypothetical protein